jgi:hypothetical protein
LGNELRDLRERIEALERSGSDQRARMEALDRDLRERVEALERRESPPWWKTSWLWTAVAAVVAFASLVVPWLDDMFSRDPDLQLSNASAQLVGTEAMLSVELENHTPDTIFIESVTALPETGPLAEGASGSLCPDRNHRDGTIPPGDSAIYRLNFSLTEQQARAYRRPTELEFTARRRVGETVDTRATSTYIGGFEGVSLSDYCG